MTLPYIYLVGGWALGTYGLTQTGLHWEVAFVIVMAVQVTLAANLAIFTAENR